MFLSLPSPLSKSKQIKFFKKRKTKVGMLFYLNAGGDRMGSHLHKNSEPLTKGLCILLV